MIPMSQMFSKMSRLRLVYVVRPEWKLNLLRISIGLVYVWFGMLKFFDNLSPAKYLAGDTLSTLCLHLVSGPMASLLLASLETLIGLLLICNIFTGRAIGLACMHMLGTFAPLAIQPHIFFNADPFGVSLLGQYILKNIIVLSALIVIYPIESNKIIK
jgi:uncharacterized membrane protein YkgB